MVGCCMLARSTVLSGPRLCLSWWGKKNPPMLGAETEFLPRPGGGVGEVGDGGGGDITVMVREPSCTVGATLTGLSLTGSGGHHGAGGRSAQLAGGGTDPAGLVTTGWGPHSPQPTAPPIPLQPVPLTSQNTTSDQHETNNTTTAHHNISLLAVKDQLVGSVVAERRGRELGISGTPSLT